MNGVERLAMVSKILFDTRLFELVRENEALQLKLFWKEHSPRMLRGCMHHANHLGPDCACFSCVVTGRHDDDIEDDEPSPLTCTFAPWFEQLVREHDMSTLEGLPDVPIWVDGRVICDNYLDVLDSDHHFVHFFNQYGTACDWAYGSKLWKATSVRDRELVKLERLFRTLTFCGPIVA
jgi:hypothetical protein